MLSTVFFSTLNHLLIHHSALLVVLVKLEFGFFGVLQQSKAENMKLSFDVVQIKQTLQTLTNSSAGIKQRNEFLSALLTPFLFLLSFVNLFHYRRKV